MNKAVIYARVSSKEQEAEGFSISAQLKLLKEHAAKNNFIVVQEFTDVDTAKKAGRKQFNKMVGFVQENRIQYILVEKTDRLLRNFADHVTIEGLTEFFNVKVHLAKENSILSKNSRSSEKLFAGFRTLMAKNYSDNLSEEVKKGMTEKAAQGTYPSHAPYGYMNDKVNGKNVISVDPHAAQYVKQMFELYATGSYSFLTLKQKMLADGMVYRNGKNFYKSAVENILKNEFYTGVFFWKGKKYENASHEPLISKELFQRVQDVRIGTSKSKSRKGLFSYTNFITCGICGCKFTAELKKGKYIYYHCSGSRGKCLQDYLRPETIDDQFERLLNKIHVSDEVREIILQTLRDSLKDKIEFHNAMVDQLIEQIKRLQKRIDQAYIDKLDDKIADDFWQTKNHEWLAEKQDLSMKLVSAQQSDSHYIENAYLVLELAKSAIQMFKTGNVEKKRRIVNLLTSNCVYKDGNMHVELKPLFGMIMESSETRNWCARLESNQWPTV